MCSFVFLILLLLITQSISFSPPEIDNALPLSSNEAGPQLPEEPPTDAQSVYRGESVVLDTYLPWMAFVLGPSICTATVVSRNYVLSAGHCVNAGGGKAYPSESVTIYVGSANLSNAIPHAVERIMLRSDYVDRYDDYIGSVTMGDMALLKLSVPLNFSETLQPIGLAKESAAGGEGLTKENRKAEVVVAGWGNTRPHCESSPLWKLTHPKIPEQLQFGRERMLPIEDCVDLEFHWYKEQMAKKMTKKQSGLIRASLGESFPVIVCFARGKGVRTGTDRKGQAQLFLYTLIRDNSDGTAAPFKDGGWKERELKRRILSKMADKLCVISDKDPHTVVESGDSGGPLLLPLGQGRWAQLGTLTGGPCHGKDAPLHDYFTQIDCEWIAIQTDNEVECRR